MKDTYAILTGTEAIEVGSLLELAGKIGTQFENGANIVTVIRKENK